MKAFRRWLTKPVVSIADALGIAACSSAAYALRLAWHLPWLAVLAIVWGALITGFILIGFAKSFARSMRS